MALSRLGNRTRPGDFTWPGFVDALASLLMVFVFVLMVFVLIQANLAYRLSGQDESLNALREELAMLGDLLSLEREAGAVLSADLARTQAQLEIAENDVWFRYHYPRRMFTRTLAAWYNVFDLNSRSHFYLKPSYFILKAYPTTHHRGRVKFRPKYYKFNLYEVEPQTAVEVQLELLG